MQDGHVDLLGIGVSSLGTASAVAAGDHADPDRRRALAGGADAADGVAVLKDEVVVSIDQTESEHSGISSKVRPR